MRKVSLCKSGPLAFCSWGRCEGDSGGERVVVLQVEAEGLGENMNWKDPTTASETKEG
jgi:hypothetical protein